MILAIVSVLAVVFFTTALLLTYKYGDVPVSQPDHNYSDDIEWSIAAAQAYSRNGRYGNVSLTEEGEAWRSTLCHGPDDCHN